MTMEELLPLKSTHSPEMWLSGQLLNTVKGSDNYLPQYTPLLKIKVSLYGLSC